MRPDSRWCNHYMALGRRLLHGIGQGLSQGAQLGLRRSLGPQPGVPPVPEGVIPPTPEDEQQMLIELLKKLQMQGGL